MFLPRHKNGITKAGTTSTTITYIHTYLLSNSARRFDRLCFVSRRYVDDVRAVRGRNIIAGSMENPKSIARCVPCQIRVSKPLVESLAHTALTPHSTDLLGTLPPLSLPDVRNIQIRNQRRMRFGYGARSHFAKVWAIDFWRAMCCVCRVIAVGMVYGRARGTIQVVPEWVYECVLPKLCTLVRLHVRAGIIMVRSEVFIINEFVYSLWIFSHSLSLKTYWTHTLLWIRKRRPRQMEISCSACSNVLRQL